MKGSARQLFAATLLASTVLMLGATRPLLSAKVTEARPFTRGNRASHLYALHRLALRDSIAALAIAQLGTPYVFGGATPQSGFDCSGLVRYVFAQAYWTPPRTAQLQALSGFAIDRASLQPGDLLTFGDGPGASHVGIYVGEGLYVHASSIAGRVILSRLDRTPTKLIRPIRGARRLLALGVDDTSQQFAPRVDAYAGLGKVERAQRIDQRQRATARVASHDAGSPLHRRAQLRADHTPAG